MGAQLCFHWLRGLRQRQVAAIIQAFQMLKWRLFREKRINTMAVDTVVPCDAQGISNHSFDNVRLLLCFPEGEFHVAVLLQYKWNDKRCKYITWDIGKRFVNQTISYKVLDEIPLYYSTLQYVRVMGLPLGSSVALVWTMVVPIQATSSICAMTW